MAFLGHGMLSSSVQWIFGPPEKSLGYVLVDQGERPESLNILSSSFAKTQLFKTHFLKPKIRDTILSGRFIALKGKELIARVNFFAKLIKSSVFAKIKLRMFERSASEQVKADHLLKPTKCHP